jgi:hypothetical protein
VRALALNAALDLGENPIDSSWLPRLLQDQASDGQWPGDRFFVEAPEVEYSSSALFTALALRAIRLVTG